MKQLPTALKVVLRGWAMNVNRMETRYRPVSMVNVHKHKGKLILTLRYSGQKGDSEVMGTFCSSKRFKFRAHHPHQVLTTPCNSSSRVFQISTLQGVALRHAHPPVCRHSCRCIIKKQGTVAMKGKMGKMVGRDLPGDQGGRATQRVKEGGDN